jgi:hypothetical protein
MTSLSRSAGGDALPNGSNLLAPARTFNEALPEESFPQLRRRPGGVRYGTKYWTVSVGRRAGSASPLKKRM